jgi:hypothetical protein
MKRTTSTTSGFRHDFPRRIWVPVWVRPQGFEIADDIHDQLSGRIVKTTLIRKRFEDNFLACRSTDGVRSTDGTLCDDCQHPDCHPQLRIHLAQGSTTLVIDLAPSSARNLMALEEQLQSNDGDLATTELELTVHNHGWWGEVRFQIL